MNAGRKSNSQNRSPTNTIAGIPRSTFRIGASPFVNSNRARPFREDVQRSRYYAIGGYQRPVCRTTVGAPIGAASVSERSSSDARFLAAKVLVGADGDRRKRPGVAA